MRYLEFFKRQMLLAHIGGIPVRIDYRWFFVLALMTWVTAGSIQTYIKTDSLTAFILGSVYDAIVFCFDSRPRIRSRVRRPDGKSRRRGNHSAPVRRNGADAPRTRHAACRISHRDRRSGRQFSGRRRFFGFDGGGKRARTQYARAAFFLYRRLKFSARGF